MFFPLKRSLFSQEYKVLYNNTYGTSSSWIGKTFKLWDTEYIEYNWGIYTADQFNKLFGWVGWFIGATGNAKAYDVVDSRALNPNPESVAGYDGKTLGWFLTEAKNQKGKKWGQCGSFVNDYLQYIWMTDAANRYYDNELSTKLNSINTEAPTVWAIAVFDYNHISKSTGKNHGHVGIVTKVTDDGIRVRDSNHNLNNPEVIEDRFIAKGSDEWNNNLKWYFDPSKPAIDRSGTTWSSTSQAWTATDRLTLTALRNGQIVNSKVPEVIDQLVKAGFSEDDINEALNQNMEYYLPDDQRAEKNAILSAFRSSDTVKNFQSSTEQLLGLSAAVEQENWAGDLASIYMFMRAQDPKSVVREWEFEMAASTMGLAGEVQTWFTKLANWERLTPQQRQNFIDVTVKVLEAKKEAYKLVYDETIDQMKAASIPSVYYPKDRATEIDNIIAKLKPQSTVQTTTSSSKKETYTPRWQQLGTYTDIYTRGGNSKATSNVGWYDLPTDFY